MAGDRRVEVKRVCFPCGYPYQLLSAVGKRHRNGGLYVTLKCQGCHRYNEKILSPREAEALGFKQEAVLTEGR